MTPKARPAAGWRPADAGRTARARVPGAARAAFSVSAMVCPSPPRRPGRHARNAPPDLRFRIAAKSDCDVILRALQELAASLGVPERLRSTRAGLERHGFGERPEFEVMLAEDDGGFAGMCLYFPFFSTWVGEPGIYVQDLYVAAARRGHRRTAAARGRPARASQWLHSSPADRGRRQCGRRQVLPSAGFRDPRTSMCQARRRRLPALLPSRRRPG